MPSYDDLPDATAASPGAALTTWSNLGPSNQGGRTRALLIDPGVSTRAPSAGSGPADGSDSVHDLVTFAASGGWRAHVVDGPQDVAVAWAQLLSSAAAA